MAPCTLRRYHSNHMPNKQSLALPLTTLTSICAAQARNIPRKTRSMRRRRRRRLAVPAPTSSPSRTAQLYATIPRITRSCSHPSHTHHLRQACRHNRIQRAACPPRSTRDDQADYSVCTSVGPSLCLLRRVKRG